MIVQIILYAPIVLLSLILAGEMFIDYKKINKWWKIVLILLIFAGNAINIYHQEEEKREEQAAKREEQASKNWYAQSNAAGLGAVSQSIANLKEQDNPLKTPQPETGSLFLDRNFLRLKSILGNDHMISRGPYLTIYFDEVSKIPNFYTSEEWKETENILYLNMVGQIHSYYAAHMPGNDDKAQAVEKEFANERSRLIKAKERWFQSSLDTLK